MKKVLLLAAVAVILVFVSCSTTSSKSSSYEVGAELAQNFMSTDVLNAFHSSSGRNPVVVIGLVSSSSANVDDSQISSGFKNTLVSSGKVDLIIGSSERDTIREERIEQLNWGNMDAAKALANEMVADFFGRIFLTPYGRGYIISADIVDVETGKVVWSEQYDKIISLPERLSSATIAQTQASQSQKPEPASETTSPATDTKEKSSDKSAGTETDVPYYSYSISIPDEYPDGTDFFVVENNSYYGADYVFRDGIFHLSSVEGKYSYLIYPSFDKDCYYTAECKVSEDGGVFNAVRHTSSFTNTGIAIPEGRILTTYTSDVLIPSNLRIQCRIGSFYSKETGVALAESTDYYLRESGELEIFYTRNDEYKVTASTKTVKIEGIEYTVIVFNITQDTDEKASLKVSYVFDYDVTDKYKSAVMLEDADGYKYYLPVASKESITIKAIPGRYSHCGVFGPLRTESGERYYPYTAPSDFTVHDGESVSVAVMMTTWN